MKIQRQLSYSECSQIETTPSPLNWFNTFQLDVSIHGAQPTTFISLCGQNHLGIKLNPYPQTRPPRPSFAEDNFLAGTNPDPI